MPLSYLIDESYCLIFGDFPILLISALVVQIKSVETIRMWLFHQRDLKSLDRRKKKKESSFFFLPKELI